MVRVVVENTYDTPITEAQWKADDAKIEPCLKERGIRWIRSLTSCDRYRSICEFEAADAETVRESYRKVGLPFERIWSADIVEPKEES
jgi:Protein of unknown function (DUF4242)